MSCETFRGEIVGCGSSVGARSPQLRGHLAECAACATLAHEQERLALLMDTLRLAEAKEVEETDEAEERTARIEARLIASFRRQHTTERRSFNARTPALSGILLRKNPTDLSSSVSSAASAARTPPQAPSVWRWGTLAAGVLVALGFLLHLLRVPNLPPPPRISYLPSPPQDSKVLTAESGPDDSRKPAVRQPRTATGSLEVSERISEVDQVKLAENSNTSDAAPDEVALAGSAEFPAGSAGRAGFIELLPLTHGFLDDGPVLMRVQVPWTTVERLRSTRGAPLAMPLSLPASGGAGITHSSVQADLLVGSDGTARAIRFVQ